MFEGVKRIGDWPSRLMAGLFASVVAIPDVSVMVAEIVGVVSLITAPACGLVMVIVGYVVSRATLD